MLCLPLFLVAKQCREASPAGTGFWVFFIVLGDQTVNTLSALLIQSGFKSGSFAGVIEVKKITVAQVKKALTKILQGGLPPEPHLAENIPEKCIEKYDEFLTEILLTQEYVTVN